jgi:type I restriction enzyme S subunit
MVVEKGYKQTEIGVIPEDWDVITLKDHVEIKSGESPAKFEMLSEGVPYYKVEQLNNHNKYTKYTPYKINSIHVIFKGSIIFPKRGASIFQNKIRLLSEDSYMDTNLMTLTTKESIFNEYLYYQLLFKGLDKVADTTSIPQINNKHITPFNVPLPPLPEQTAIANALSDMDALIAQTEKLIEKKKAIKQGVMQELLKPKEGWVTKKLGEVGMCLRGVSYSPETDLDLDENENNLSLLRSNNIQDGLLDKNNLQFVKSHIVKEFQIIKDSDIIICMANGSKQLVGKAAIIDNIKRNRYTYGAFMGCFRVNSNNNPNFIFALMESKQYRDYIDILLAGSSINNLNPGAIESMSFQIPERSIQDSIAELLGDIQKSIIKNQAKLQKLKYKKQGMMQALLTGKIRLI